MKQLTIAFLAILFAGFGVAAMPAPRHRLITTTIYKEGSTTMEPILPDGDDSDHFKERNDLIKRVQNLSKQLTNYEMYVLKFVSNANQVLTSFYFDSGDNLVELTNYLPSSEKKNSRRKCYCEDTFHEPCPMTCINSCYIANHGYYKDCTMDGIPSLKANIRYCYQGSQQIIARNIGECYDPPTAEPCYEYAVNLTNLKESFLQFAKLLVEPARIKVRGVQRNLKFVKDSIYSMEYLSNLSGQYCIVPQNNLCFPGATELMETKVKYYEEMAKNITKDLVDTQTEIDRIEGSMHVLTEGAIKQINDATKNYACCLNGLNFQVEGLDCESPATKAIIQAMRSTTQAPPLYSQFLCDSGETIPPRLVCDGENNCYDGSDEVRCRNEFYH